MDSRVTLTRCPMLAPQTLLPHIADGEGGSPFLLGSQRELPIAGPQLLHRLFFDEAAREWGGRQARNLKEAPCG